MNPEEFDLIDKAPVSLEEAYAKGVAMGAIYMFMTFEVGDDGCTPVYVMPGENIGQIGKWCEGGGHIISEHDLTQPFQKVA